MSFTRLAPSPPAAVAAAGVGAATRVAAAVSVAAAVTSSATGDGAAVQRALVPRE
ncbi:MAG: hypothetical protein V2J16_01595 [Thermoleophilia bacterium]|jgi:hypothetical protein|nr:hypothetical protein [Thermoleophilia bacterium]